MAPHLHHPQDLNSTSNSNYTPNSYTAVHQSPFTKRNETTKPQTYHIVPPDCIEGDQSACIPRVVSSTDDILEDDYVKARDLDRLVEELRRCRESEEEGGNKTVSTGAPYTNTSSSATGSSTTSQDILPSFCGTNVISWRPYTTLTPTDTDQSASTLIPYTNTSSSATGSSPTSQITLPTFCGNTSISWRPYTTLTPTDTDQTTSPLFSSTSSSSEATPFTTVSS